VEGIHDEETARETAMGTGGDISAGGSVGKLALRKSDGKQFEIPAGADFGRCPAHICGRRTLAASPRIPVEVASFWRPSRSCAARHSLLPSLPRKDLHPAKFLDSLLALVRERGFDTVWRLAIRMSALLSTTTSSLHFCMLAVRRLPSSSAC